MRRWLDRGNGHAKTRAVARSVAGSSNGPVVRFDDTASDCEAHPQAPTLVISLSESLEAPLQIQRAHPHSRIINRDVDRRSAILSTNLQPSGVIAELGGILDQVTYHLLHPDRIYIRPMLFSLETKYD